MEDAELLAERFVNNSRSKSSINVENLDVYSDLSQVGEEEGLKDMLGVNGRYLV